ERDVEMVFDRTFFAAGNDQDRLDAACDRLLNGVLDKRFVHERKHFFWRCLGRRQKPGAETRSGENGLANFICHNSFAKFYKTIDSRLINVWKQTLSCV